MSRPVARTIALCATAMTTGVVAPPRRIRRSDYSHQALPGGCFDIESHGLPLGSSEVVGWFDRLDDTQRLDIADHLGRLEDLGHRFEKPEPLRARRRG